MLIYICLPRLFYLGLRSGLLTGNFGQSPQSWVYVTVDKVDNKALHLFRGAAALTMERTSVAASKFAVSSAVYPQAR